MHCLRCGNQDERYFFKGEKGIYCRKCIAYRRFLLHEPAPLYLSNQDDLLVDYTLDFKLTKAQETAIKQIEEILPNKDVVVHAVCGAGKTEMMYPIIKQYLSQHKTVGFAIPRRQVVLALSKRLKQAFSGLKVVGVCQGFTDDVWGDVIVCTTHQLFRYYRYFDLLIIDEPDAFPFAGDEVLQGIAQSSCRGRLIYLTATPPASLAQYAKVELFRRPHLKPLPEPVIKLGPTALLLLDLLKFKRSFKKTLIFVPTIKLAKQLSYWLKLPCLHSKSVNQAQIINEFIELAQGSLICTSILERGVTFINIHVAVFWADHPVFTAATLIQIAGRVGRHPAYPTGSVWFLTRKQSYEVSQCCYEIKRMNA